MTPSINFERSQLLDMLPLIKRELDTREIRYSRRPEDIKYMHSLYGIGDAIEQELEREYGPPLKSRNWGDGWWR